MPCLASLIFQPKKLSGATGVAEKMRELELANVRVIKLLGGAMVINCWEIPV
ncbi:MAG: hypothetical protein WBW41_21070 [Verrucomicrobiia bacterium]